ncbi:unnamed protein product [Owenia fusiformis]|uniref:Uncharacterized protein n=1 Tax=Owenia fusiformis TaxID=6347 RepID=A0A8J1USR1_OWEFU|nr:unnamed protein product [Owenia fusiformis]
MEQHQGEEFGAEIQQHRNILEGICRVCAKKIVTKTKKETFSRELLVLYNINIIEDNPLVHPPFLCTSHRCSLRRQKEKSAHNQPYSTKNADLFNFQPHHNDNCTVCILQKERQYVEQDNNTHAKRKRLDPIELKTLIDAFLLKPEYDRIAFFEAVIPKLSKTEKNRFIEIFARNDDLSPVYDEMKKMYKSLEEMKTFSSESLVNSMNDISIVSYCKGLVPQDRYSAPKIVIILESLLSMTYHQFIGPLSFLTNLNLQSVNVSPKCADILGSVIPSGKRKTLGNWFDIQAKNPPIFPSGDVIVTFDNEQIIGKSWSISHMNKAKVSVITNKTAAVIESNKSIQERKDLKPKYWLKIEGNESAVSSMTQDNESESTTKYLEIHHQEQHLYINTFLSDITKESKTRDDIDNKVQQNVRQRLFKTCTNCNYLNDKTKRKCKECHAPLTPLVPLTPTNIDKQQNRNKIAQNKIIKENDDSEMYSHIKSNHTRTDRPAMMDPTMVNPNSYASLEAVMRDIGKEAGIERYGGSIRHWLSVCCDGLPFSLLINMIFDHITCQSCNKTIIGEDEFKIHLETEHPIDEPKYYREFDWVLLIPGDGHYEMNLVKSYVELMWEVCYKELVRMLGWRSDAALVSAKKCRDYHKAWQTLIVFIAGTLKEMLTTYNRSPVGADSQNTTSEGFVMFCKQHRNPTIRFMFDMVCELGIGILNLRAGIRRNNCNVIMSAKRTTRSLFHGRNHPKYQTIEIFENFQYLCMPDEVRKLIDENRSLSKSGHKSKGQAWDFILEEDNQEVKKWVNRGVPSEHMWRKICRNVDGLDKIKQNFQESLMIDGANEDLRYGKLDDAVEEWRCILREKEFFNEENTKLVSLSGEELDSQLEDFIELSEKKRSNRILEKLEKGKPCEENWDHPVHVTKDEREEFTSFENKTVNEIDMLILDTITSLPDELQPEYCTTFKKTIMNKPKQKHIEFFNRTAVKFKISLLKVLRTDPGMEHRSASSFMNRLMIASMGINPDAVSTTPLSMHSVPDVAMPEDAPLTPPSAVQTIPSIDKRGINPDAVSTTPLSMHTFPDVAMPEDAPLTPPSAVQTTQSEDKQGPVKRMRTASGIAARMTPTQDDRERYRNWCRQRDDRIRTIKNKLEEIRVKYGCEYILGIKFKDELLDLEGDEDMKKIIDEKFWNKGNGQSKNKRLNQSGIKVVLPDGYILPKTPSKSNSSKTPCTTIEPDTSPAVPSGSFPNLRRSLNKPNASGVRVRLDAVLKDKP